LASTYSFKEAFAMACGSIRKWERERGEIPSNPQIWIGKEMERKLVQLQKRFTLGNGALTAN